MCVKVCGLGADPGFPKGIGPNVKTNTSIIHMQVCNVFSPSIMKFGGTKKERGPPSADPPLINV